MTTHTPGPLSYNGPHDTIYDIDKEHYMAYRVTDSGGKVIAYVASLEDVKLFRVAPELLEALEKLYDFAEETQAAFRNLGLDVPVCKGKADAILAIAKATQ